MKKHYIYKITVMEGPFKDHYYIGKRSNEDPENDIYSGSGVKLPYIKRNFRFIKEILSFHSDEQEAYDKEKELVCYEALMDPYCLNVVLGGRGHKTGDKLSQWYFYDELFELWVNNGLLGYGRFGRLAVSLGYPNEHYGGLIAAFEKNSGLKANSNTKTLGVPSSKRKEHWLYEKELFEHWVKMGRCGHRSFKRKMVALNYPDVSYYQMVENFKVKQ